MKRISIPTGRERRPPRPPPRRPCAPSGAGRVVARRVGDRPGRLEPARGRTAGNGPRSPRSGPSGARPLPYRARSRDRRAARPPASDGRRRSPSVLTGLRSSIRPRHRCWNSASPTASTSSTSSTSGSRWAATENASRTYMPLEYRFTGVSMNCSTPENSRISSSLRDDLRAASSRGRAVEVDVLAPRQLRVEAGPDLEEAPDASPDLRPSARSARDPREDLQERRLPGSVRPITPTTSPSRTSNDTSSSAQISSSAAGARRPSRRPRRDRVAERPVRAELAEPVAFEIPRTLMRHSPSIASANSVRRDEVPEADDEEGDPGERADSATEVGRRRADDTPPEPADHGGHRVEREQQLPPLGQPLNA